MILKEGCADEDAEAPLAAKVRSLVYPIQMLPGRTSVLARCQETAATRLCSNTYFNLLMSMR